MKKVVGNLIEKRRERYAGSQKDALLASFKNVWNYRSCEKPVPFNVTTLFPGKREDKVVEQLAIHFNKIRVEFEPLEAHQIPTTKWRQLPTLLPFRVAERIKAFKKPKSIVR